MVQRSYLLGVTAENRIAEGPYFAENERLTAARSELLAAVTAGAAPVDLETVTRRVADRRRGDPSRAPGLSLEGPMSLMGTLTTTSRRDVKRP